ncbi:MAG: DJ-1/PfpI family protein [Candidatus Babeliales bacterium]|nr:DJ-1/PfpI family protein [Candidatus Babeliales bacterium]
MIAAILLNGQYKTKDFQYSLLRLKQAGCAAVIIAPELKTYYSLEKKAIEPDMIIDDIDPEKFDLLIITGKNSWNEPETIKLIQEFSKFNHTIAILDSATNISRKVTIITNSQKNVIFSEDTQDLPQFISKILESLPKKK